MAQSEKAKTWEVFSLWVRLRDSFATTGTLTHCKCISCGELFPFHRMHAGHFVGGRGNAVLFDPEICNAQCDVCNTHLGGNPEGYEQGLLKRGYTGEDLEAMRRKRHQTVKFTRGHLTWMRENYNRRIANIRAVAEVGGRVEIEEVPR